MNTGAGTVNAALTGGGYKLELQELLIQNLGTELLGQR
jgi:hypothetical protein